MTFSSLLRIGGFFPFALTISLCQASAQQGSLTGWGRSLDAETIYRGTRDLDDGGEFSASRNIAGFGLRHSAAEGSSISFGFSLGATDYDFDGSVDPWGRINEVSLAVPISLAMSETARAIIVPILRYNGESGVDLQDGDTAGIIAAASWQVGDRFRIGPGFGAFNTLDEATSFDVFPFLLIDWQISDRLSVGNGDGFGATQGPGVGIRYQARDTLSTGLFVRRDDSEFRLDGDGMAPGGTGRDKATSVVATVSYQPSPRLDLSGFLGAELGGQLTLRDSDGNKVNQRDYDPAPIVGAKVAIRF